MFSKSHQCEKNQSGVYEKTTVQTAYSFHYGVFASVVLHISQTHSCNRAFFKPPKAFQPLVFPRSPASNEHFYLSRIDWNIAVLNQFVEMIQSKRAADKSTLPDFEFKIVCWTDKIGLEYSNTISLELMSMKNVVVERKICKSQLPCIGN